MTKKKAEKHAAPAAKLEARSADVTVRFLVRDAPFEAGQEVVFPRATADRLITAGVAVAVLEELED